MFEKNETETLSYQQWISKDTIATTLVKLELPVQDFICELCDFFHKLRSHHYIANVQSKYHTELKEQLDENSIIILLDFAENYSFVVQDAVQGYHWSNSQATLHRFVVYYRNDKGKLANLNFCILSDSLNHDADAVHAFIRLVLMSIKQRLPLITQCIYFSDGAPSQYKNFKTLFNLYHHFSDQ